MAQLVVAAAGAAIGGMIAPGIVAFGMTGASLGWMAGSMLGSAMFAPTQKSQGPRLGDLSVGGSAYGTPIPWVAGSPRISGQVVWASAKREIANTQSAGGKGGGGSEYTTYTYEVDLLILLTDNIMAGVPQVWKNGELVYSILSDADDTTVEASINNGGWSRMTVYTGAADQLPDPDYEAAVGTANACAYRGRCTVFIKSLQLGGGGQIPNLTFRPVSLGYQNNIPVTYPGVTTLDKPENVVVKGDIAFVICLGGTAVQAFNIQDPNNMYLVGTLNTVNRYSGLSLSGDELGCYGRNTTFLIVNISNPSAMTIVETISYSLTDGIGDPQNYYFDEAILDGNLVISSSHDNYLSKIVFYDRTTHEIRMLDGTLQGTIFAINGFLFYRSNSHVGAIDYRDLNALAYVSSLFVGDNIAGFINYGSKVFVSYIYNPAIVKVIDCTDKNNFNVIAQFTVGSVGNNLYIFNNKLYAFTYGHMKIEVYSAIDYQHLYDIDVPSFTSELFVKDNILYLLSYAQDKLFIIAPAAEKFTVQNVSLMAVVDSLLAGSGIPPALCDTSSLSSVLRPVRALANGSVSTARTLLEMLASTYQFEAVLADKIYFRPRGGAPVATITFDELGVMQDSTNPPDPLPLTQANELEIPAQMALTYNNVDGDYQTDTQYSDRLLTGMESTSAVQVPMGFTASEAKAIADTSLMDKAVSALSTTVNVGIEYAKLEPTDVILLTGEDTSQYRMRIIKRTDAGGVTTLQCVGDDASVLTQAGVTDTAASGQTTVAALATTTLELMDLPALRDVDNLPGLYVAVTGSATNWTSAAVYDSLDDITYTTQSLITSQAPLGTCSTALGNWAGGNVFDETNTVTVNVGLQQLASVTYADILANTATNAALVGNELIQYRVATLVSAGVYTLSGLLRGRRGTEDAMTGHVAAERFVALGISGVRFLPLQSGDLARLRYYKGVSASQALSAVTAQSITPVGNTLKPFAPVHPRANRDAADTVISWTRQTRLSTRIVGALPPSIPLGETAESYEVEIWDSGYTTLKRTLASSTQTVTYTNAQQVTDFGSAQVTLYVKIYQLSATVGRGKPLTASI